MSDDDLCIDALRQKGAQQFDPVRYRYLEALARRLPQQPVAVQRLLHVRLQAGLKDYLERCTRADEQSPGQAPRPKPCAPLVDLNHYIQSQTSAGNAGDWPGDSAVLPDLKSVRCFGEAWQRRAAQDQVGQAIERGPVNAGPLNSHMLVLRSLALARDLSPAYLRRHLSHLQALLWLDQVNLKKTRSTANKSAGRARTKKQAAG